MRFPERFSNLPAYAFPRLRALLDHHPAGGPVRHMTIGEPKHAFPSGSPILSLKMPLDLTVILRTMAQWNYSLQFQIGLQNDLTWLSMPRHKS